MSQPLIDEFDRTSAVWKKLKPFLEARLESLRKMNDSPKRGADVTAYLRGQIAELKVLIALDKETPKVPSEADLGFKD